MWRFQIWLHQNFEILFTSFRNNGWCTFLGTSPHPTNGKETDVPNHFDDLSILIEMVVSWNPMNSNEMCGLRPEFLDIHIHHHFRRSASVPRVSLRLHHNLPRAEQISCTTWVCAISHVLMWQQNPPWLMVAFDPMIWYTLIYIYIVYRLYDSILLLYTYVYIDIPKCWIAVIHHRSCIHGQAAFNKICFANTKPCIGLPWSSFKQVVKLYNPLATVRAWFPDVAGTKMQETIWSVWTPYRDLPCGRCQAMLLHVLENWNPTCKTTGTI